MIQHGTTTSPWARRPSTFWPTEGVKNPASPAYRMVPPTMILFWVPMAGLYELGIWLCKLAPRSGAGEEFELSESEEMVEV